MRSLSRNILSMTKKLNADAITSELSESAYFRRPQRQQPESNTPASLPETPTPSPGQMTTDHDTMIPRHHDTTVSRNHDTTTPIQDTDIFEVVRKAVKQIGKEAATYRFTVEEKNLLTDIKYTYKRRGVITSENEITRIAINYLIEEYHQNGEQSILAKILKRLNS
jgi:hypothetical protein